MNALTSKFTGVEVIPASFVVETDMGVNGVFFPAFIPKTISLLEDETTFTFTGTLYDHSIRPGAETV
jgi:hypothetical protein